MVACYNCGCEEGTFYAEENGFTLRRCVQCGLLLLADRPSDDQISQAHKQGKHTGLKQLDVTGKFAAGKIPRYISILRELFGDRLPVGTKWLDVGCGHGELLVAIQTCYPGQVSVRGTEPNAQKRASALKRGLDVDYFDLESHNERYDVISLLNVYSHLPDPPRFLQSLSALLRPGGELLIETGDSAHLAPDEHHRPFYLPDHLSFASEAIVVGILERIGFRVVGVRKYPFGGLGVKALVKEIAKTVLPHYQSGLRNFRKRHLHAQTDMFIRARLHRA
jgi:SAM-dependent methyltransferase